MILSSEGCLIEPVCNAVSLHQIKKEFKGSLIDYFKHVRNLTISFFVTKQTAPALIYWLQEFGEVSSEEFLTARRNFVESCAAYCLVCYFIQIKDR